MYIIWIKSDTKNVSTYFWTSTTSMVWCYRCCATLTGNGGQVTCWFSTAQRHHTIGACTIQCWMWCVQGLYKNEYTHVFSIHHNITFKKKAPPLMVHMEAMERQPNVRQGKWIFNGNILCTPYTHTSNMDGNSQSVCKSPCTTVTWKSSTHPAL